jgi:hypothetical protein
MVGRALTLRKNLMQFVVYDNAVAALSSSGTKMYRVQQWTKK